MTAIAHKQWHATATILFYARYIQPRSESMFGQFNDDHSTLHVSAYTKCAEASQTVIDAIQQLDRYQLLREACADFLYIISLTTLFQSEYTASWSPRVPLSRRS